MIKYASPGSPVPGNRPTFAKLPKMVRSVPSAPVAPCGPVGPAGPSLPCGPVAPAGPPCGPAGPSFLGHPLFPEHLVVLLGLPGLLGRACYFHFSAAYKAYGTLSMREVPSSEPSKLVRTGMTQWTSRSWQVPPWSPPAPQGHVHQAEAIARYRVVFSIDHGAAGAAL